MIRSTKIFTSLLALGFVGAANAADSGSEFWYSPKGGQSALTVGLRSQSYKTELTATGATSKWGDYESTSMPVNLRFDYGLNDTNSVGAYLDFGTEKGTTTQVGQAASEEKSTGMSDIHLTYSGNQDGKLQYGADFTLGFAKHKKGSSSPAKDGDRLSGGMALEPYIGYHMAEGGSGFGAKLAYKFNMERTTVTQGTTDTENKVTGGNTMTLTPYYEMNHGSGFVDFYFSYANTADSSETPAGGTASSAGGNTLMSLGAKGNYDFSGATALFEASYNMVSNFNASSNFEKAKFNFLAFGLGVRMTF